MGEKGCAPVSKRLEGKAATQERILVAATELFMESGYERTTVSAVAERAGVSRATVFWHFSHKDGLFQEAFSRLLDPFLKSFDRDYGDLEPEKRLYELLAMSEQFSQEHGAEIAAFVRWAVDSSSRGSGVVTTLLDVNQRFAGVLTEAVAALGPSEHDPKMLALGLMLAFDANLVLSLFEPRAQRSEERRAAVQAYADLIVGSVRPKG
jgi:AcrR family transcriptional regulator